MSKRYSGPRRCQWCEQEAYAALSGKPGNRAGGFSGNIRKANVEVEIRSMAGISHRVWLCYAHNAERGTRNKS